MATTTQPTSFIDWSALIGGTLIACAVSLILIPFGNALGLTFTNLNSDDVVTWQSVLTISLWMLWVQLSASLTGGYFAGRAIHTPNPNTHESELRDGAHGLLVWAFSTVLAAIAIGVTSFWAALAAQNGVEPEVALSAELAKKLGIITGFSLAATSLVSAAAAWAIAVLGGDHRDNKLDVSKFVTFRRR